jgi:DNA polymerase IV
VSSKIILHIDLNQFFITCERIKDRSLEGKPLIVGGDGRGGIVSTASYEARKYGVRSGMPTFQAKMLCKNLIIKSVDFKFYELMSKEFITYIKQFSSVVEQTSVDECFVDFTETFESSNNKNILDLLKGIQDGLYKKTKLMCSIGVASTLFLAKMGSDIKKPMGITIIRKRDISKIIFPLSIKDFFGIGKKTYPKLEELGITTIGIFYESLKQNNPDVLNVIGNMKDHYLLELEGKSNDIIDTKPWEPKSIGVSRTLIADSNDREYLNDFLLKISNNVILDMKNKGFLTKTITISFKDADYDKTHFKVSSFSKSFNEYTDDIDAILRATSKLFYKSYDGRLIRLIGFTVKNLKVKHDIVKQLTFDNYEENEKEDETKLLIGKLNRATNSNTFMRLSDLEKK